MKERGTELPRFMLQKEEILQNMEEGVIHWFCMKTMGVCSLIKCLYNIIDSYSFNTIIRSIRISTLNVHNV